MNQYGFADPTLDSFINVDIDWMQHFCGGQTKAPEPSRWSNAMNDDLELELLQIINAANKRSRLIAAAPAINTGAMGSWDMAAGTMGSWNAALVMNNLDATPVTTTAAPPSSSSLITNNVPGVETASALQRYSSALPTEPAAAAVAAAVAESTGGLCRAAGAAKVKKKRVRPSRRVPTTVVKTDTSNFKAMVQHYTGIPPTMTTAPGESTATPCGSSSSPESTNSANSPSSFPHPGALCKISNSSFANPSTTASATMINMCPSPLLPSSFPSRESLSALPFTGTGGSITGCHQIRSCAEVLEEQINIPLIDAAFIETLWSY